MKKAIPMKCSSRKILLLTLLLLGKGIILHAQDELPRHEFTFKVGELVYQGDLTPEQFGAFKTRRLAWEVQFTRILTNTFSLKANVLWGNITAHDHLYKKPTWRQQRNFNFKSPLTEFSLRLQMKVGRHELDEGLSTYVFGGVGITFLDIERDWNNLNRDYFINEPNGIIAGLAVDSAHSTSHMIIVAPVGAGIRYFFTEHWGINAEGTYRLTGTDYIDGFSKSADPKHVDNYFGYSVGLLYRPGRMGRSWKCPVFY